VSILVVHIRSSDSQLKSIVRCEISNNSDQPRPLPWWPAFANYTHLQWTARNACYKIQFLANDKFSSASGENWSSTMSVSEVMIPFHKKDTFIHCQVYPIFAQWHLWNFCTTKLRWVAHCSVLALPQQMRWHCGGKANQWGLLHWNSWQDCETH